MHLVGKRWSFWLFVMFVDVCEFAGSSSSFFFFKSDCVPKPIQMGRKLKCSWLEVSEDRTWGWQRSLGINLISKRTYDLNYIDKIISLYTTWQLWRRKGIYKPERKKNGGEPWWPIKTWIEIYPNICAQIFGWPPRYTGAGETFRKLG